MLTQKISEIFKDLSIQFEELLFDCETFEEPPLINTYPDAEKFCQDIKREDLNTFFFNLALAHLNNTVLYAKSRLGKEAFADFFICLTYNDDENETDGGIQDFGFYIPSFLITRKERLLNLQNRIKKYPVIDLDSYPIIKKTLTDLNLARTMDVRISEWDDPHGGRLKRFYFLVAADS